MDLSGRTFWISVGVAGAAIGVLLFAPLPWAHAFAAAFVIAGG